MQQPVEPGVGQGVGHEAGLRGPGERVDQRLLGAEVVGHDPAAVAGAFPDPGQGERLHTAFDDQFRRGVQQGGAGLLAAFGLAAAGGAGDHGETLSAVNLRVD